MLLHPVFCPDDKLHTGPKFQQNDPGLTACILVPVQCCNIQNLHHFLMMTNCEPDWKFQLLTRTYAGEEDSFIKRDNARKEISMQSQLEMACRFGLRVFLTN